MPMITAATWVPRGAASRHPEHYVFDDAEYSRVSKLAQLELDNARERLASATERSNGTNGNDHAGSDNIKGELQKNDEEDAYLKEYGLDHYDDDDVDEEAEEGEEGGEEGGNVGLSSGGLTMFGNLNSLTYHEPNEEDPYLLLPRKRDGSDADDWSVEEREEQEILPTDNLIVTGRVEDEVAQLEVYVYEDDVDNLYVHHDVMLPAIPLAVEWLGPVRLGGEESDGSIQGVGNYVAVGTMDPDIELWNLDVIDSLYPDSVLGLGTGQKDLSTKDSSSGKTKKKSKRRKKANDEYHVDAVLALAANRLQGKLLASASADRTVKLWDLEQCQCAQSYEMHEDKVCALAWHKTESAALLSGSYGGLVVLSDMRAPGGQMPRWTVGSDVEVIRWDIQQQTNFYVSTESGAVFQFDARQPVGEKGAAGEKEGKAGAIWTLQAHDGATSALEVSSHAPGLMVTGSTDRTVKLWDLRGQGNERAGPRMLLSRDFGVGKVFTATFAPDKEVGFRVAVAGSEGSLRVWDVLSNSTVRHAFGGGGGGTLPRKREGGGEEEERVVGVADASEGSSSGSEDDGEEDGAGREQGGSMDTS